MDEGHPFLEFLLEDLNLLLVHASSSSIPVEKIQQVKSLSEDLKFIISFLKEVPESFSEKHSSVQNNESFGTQDMSSVFLLKRMEEQVKSIKKKILGVDTDASCDENLSRGSSNGSNAEIEVVLGYGEEKKALLERLTGGHKELEVISYVGMTNTLVDVYDDPVIVDHFKVRRKGNLCQNEPQRKLLEPIIGTLSGDKGSGYGVNVQKLGERQNELFKGKRYLIVIYQSFDFEIWVDLKKYFPNDVNGSKICLFHPRSCPDYQNEEGGWDPLASELHKTHVHAKTRVDHFCRKMRNIACEPFQSPEHVVLAGKIRSMKKEIMQVYVDGFPDVRKLDGNFVSENSERETSSSFKLRRRNDCRF